MHFTGKEHDPESGLDYFGARYDSSQYGRFMTPDPMGGKRSDPQTLNKYAYVGNNPITLMDPTGLYACGDDMNACQTKNDKRFADALIQLRNSGARGALEAYNFGKAGVDNGITVDFKSEKEMGGPGNLGNTSFSGTSHVSPQGIHWVGNVRIESDFRTGLEGTDLLQTVAHEGSHVLDDLNFVHSFDFSTNKFDSASNFTKHDTEFKAFEMGATIKPYTDLACGNGTPCGTIDSSVSGRANLERYLSTNPRYKNGIELEFNPQLWPQ